MTTPDSLVTSLTYHDWFVLLVIGLTFFTWWMTNFMLGAIRDGLEESRKVHTAFYDSIIKYLRRQDGDR